jgi:hypothetical protein
MVTIPLLFQQRLEWGSNRFDILQLKSTTRPHGDRQWRNRFDILQFTGTTRLDARHDHDCRPKSQLTSNLQQGQVRWDASHGLTQSW